MAHISVTPSPQYRDAAGRFARVDATDLVAARLLRLGTDILNKIRPATPVRSGFMQQHWFSSYTPSTKTLEIGDRASYARYVILGTRRMPPNANLRAVIAGIPADAGIALRDIGQGIVQRLKGG